jgi:crotonobetaine/carnitine-CoA ligase
MGMSAQAAGARALHPFAGADVWRLVQTRARVSGEATAFIWHPYHDDGQGGRTWTFAQLHRDASRIGAALQRRGVGRGDHVLIHLENSPEFVLTWFACAAVGAMAVTTNTRSAVDELRYFVGHCEPVGIVTQPRFVETLAAIAPLRTWLVVTDHDSGVPDESPLPDGIESFAHLLDEARPVESSSSPGPPGDLAVPPSALLPA